MIVIIRAAGGIAVFLIVPPADSIPVAICGMEQIRENIAGIVIGSNRPVLVPSAIGIPVWIVVQLDCFSSTASVATKLYGRCISLAWR